MKPTVLWFVTQLNSLWRALGADPLALRAIVDVKLTMDSRRSYASLGRYGQSSNEENSNQFLLILGIYSFAGLLAAFGLFFAQKEALFLPLTLTVAYVMVFCAMTLLSDFSTLILDATDNQIILPRPVSGRTLLLARIVHVSVYLLSIALALSLVGIITVTVRFGPLAGLMLTIMCLLGAILMVFLTNVFYLLLMQFTSEERLREIINYFQIVTAIVFYGGYQFLPRLMGGNMLTEAAEWKQWFYAVPPMWMAGAVEMVVQPAFDARHALLTALAIVTPFAGLFVMNRVLAPVFNTRLAGMEQDYKPTVESSGSEQGGSLMQRLGQLLTSNPLERAAFGFTWRVTDRDRKFKLKVYPQLGFGLAYIVFMSLNRSGGTAMGGGFYLFALYYTGLFVMTAQYQLAASDDYKAAWVYGSAPINRPGEILSGSMKALIMKLMVPFYIAVAAYIIWRFGVDKIDDVLLAFSNSLVMSMITALITERRLPFSMAQDAVKRSNVARNFIVLFALGMIGVAHYFLGKIPYAVWIATPFSLAIFWYLFRHYRQTDWTRIAFE